MNCPYLCLGHGRGSGVRRFIAAFPAKAEAFPHWFPQTGEGRWCGAKKGRGAEAPTPKAGRKPRTPKPPRTPKLPRQNYPTLRNGPALPNTPDFRRPFPPRTLQADKPRITDVKWESSAHAGQKGAQKGPRKHDGGKAQVEEQRSALPFARAGPMWERGRGGIARRPAQRLRGVWEGPSERAVRPRASRIVRRLA